MTKQEDLATAVADGRILPEPEVYQHKSGQFIPDAVKCPPGLTRAQSFKPMPWWPAMTQWPVLETAYNFQQETHKEEWHNDVPFQLFSDGNPGMHPNCRSYFDRDRAFVRCGMPKVEMCRPVSWILDSECPEPPIHPGLARILKMDKFKEKKRKEAEERNRILAIQGKLKKKPQTKTEKLCASRPGWNYYHHLLYSQHNANYHTHLRSYFDAVKELRANTEEKKNEDITTDLLYKDGFLYTTKTRLEKDIKKKVSLVTNQQTGNVKISQTKTVEGDVEVEVLKSRKKKLTKLGLAKAKLGADEMSARGLKKAFDNVGGFQNLEVVTVPKFNPNKKEKKETIGQLSMEALLEDGQTQQEELKNKDPNAGQTYKIDLIHPDSKLPLNKNEADLLHVLQGEPSC